MATARDIIQAAMRKVGILGMGDAASADDAESALVSLNAMMHGWKLRSVDIGHTDLDLSSTFPLAAEFEEGTTYLLASRIAPDFERPQSFDADDWFRTLQAAYHVPLTMVAPDALNRPPSREDREGNLPLVES